MVALIDLPTDIIHLVFCHLDIPDVVLNVRQTCKHFHSISQSHAVWQSLLGSVVKQQIPIPCLFDRSFDSLSSAELEHLARKALTLRQNWMAKSPVLKRTLTIKLDPFPYREGGVPPSFEFIKRTGKRHVLTLTMKSRSHEGSLFELQCWDLEVSPPQLVAHREVDRGWLAVNNSLDSLASLAVQSPAAIELLGIDYSAKNPTSGFYEVSKLHKSTGRLVAFNASLLVIQNDRQQLYLSHMQNDDDHIELRGRQPMIEQVLEVMMQNEVVIVIRKTILEVFSARDLDTNKTAIYPITQYIFQWKLDSVSVSAQATSTQRSEREYPTINVLIRFGSPLPWPVNLLHHFVLLPNPRFEINLPPSPENVPYYDTPVMKRSIGSPVRLFAKYNMAIGSRGTAIFVDSHTEDYFGRGDIGQRLAGSHARDIPAVESDEGFQLQEDSTEVESTMDSSVFGYSENEEWTRVAVDEEEGRIAVGFLDGTIEIGEYA